VIGLIAAGCVMGTFSASAFAKPKEKLIFGKFVASTSGKATGKGTVSALTLGPYRFTGELIGEGEYGPICKHIASTSRGEVEEGESETFTQDVKFEHCITYRAAGNDSGGLKEKLSASFTLGITFHSNRSGELGHPEPESATIEEAPVMFKASHSECKVVIPFQHVPLKSGGKLAEEGYEEFEAALYETEEQSLEGKPKAEKEFGEFRDRLNIETAFKKVKSEVPEHNGCLTSKEKEAKHYEEGVIKIDLEKITLKDGNISFVPPEEEE